MAKTIEYPRTIKRGSAVVKIYRKHERGTVRFSIVHSSGGVRKFETLTDERKAFERAEKIAESLAGNDHEGAKLTGAERAAFIAAEQELAACGASIVTAAHVYAEAFKILGGDRLIEAARFFKAHSDESLPDYTVKEAVAKFRAAKEGEGISDKYTKDLRLMLDGLATAFACPLAAVTSDDLRGYLSAKKCGPVAKNNHGRVIRAFFNHAKESGWLSRSLPTAADSLPTFKVAEKAVEIFTPAEVEALLAAADSDFVPWLALIAFGGLRHEELAKGFAWESVNFERGSFIVPGEIAKTGRKRKMDMPPNLRAWLAPFREKAGPVYAQDPEFRIRKTCTAAKVVWKRNALRHSFGSYRLESVKNAGQVALEMGNSPGIVLKHYHELVDRADAKAYWAIRPSV